MEPCSSSLVCIPEMRDPMTWVATFLRNPGPLRNTCSFMTLCYNHSVYLESAQGCPYVTLSSDEREVALKNENNDNDEPRAEVEHKIPVLLKNMQTTHFRDLCKVHLVDLPALTKIDGTTLGYCMNRCIHELHVARLNNLTTMGNGFLHYCPNVKEVVFEDCAELSGIGDNWMYSCGVVSVTVRNMPKLTKVGNSWLNVCKNLERVTLENLPMLERVGTQWMMASPQLQEVRVKHIPMLLDRQETVQKWNGEVETRLLKGLGFLQHQTSLNECLDVSRLPPEMQDRSSGNHDKAWRWFSSTIPPPAKPDDK